MTCLDFLDVLDRLARGACPADEQREAEAHAAACRECGELLRAVRMRDASLVPAPRVDGVGEGDAGGNEFIRSVLERTSGPACGRAEDLLCDFVDGLLPPPQAAVLADHLDHCAACRGLAAALREMDRVLAALATLDPGAGFIDEVLARTSLAAAGRAPSLSQRWRDLPQRLAGAWDRLLARPRIGFEMGYVGALLILLVFGNPAATVQAASERLSRPSAGLGQLGALPGAILSLDVSRAAGEVARLDRVSAELSERRTALTQETESWWARVSGMLESVWNTGRGALAWLVREVGDAWVRLQDALADWMARAAAARRPEPGEPSGR